MLSSLYIENIAVARRLDIDFGTGFNVITGKTGAGKSIIIDSLLLLCGSKHSKDLIRTGEEKAQAVGIFKLSPEEISALEAFDVSPDENSELEIARYLTSDGRSSAKINRRPVPITLLKEIAPVIMGVQTQDERSEFADKTSYVSLLDLYAEDSEELNAYKAEYLKLCDVQGRIADLKKAMSDREMMLEILKYQKKEIESAKLSSDDEEEKLVKLRTKIKSIEKVSKYSSVVTKALSSNEKGVTAAYLIERAEQAITQLSDVLEDADTMLEKLQNFRYEILDIAERVSDELDDAEIGNPQEKLTQIESRLNLISKLEKKYGPEIKDIKLKLDEINSKISDLEDSDFRMAELEKELLEAEKNAGAAARILSAKRKAAGEELQRLVISSLERLELPKARFLITVDAIEEDGKYQFRPDGYDDVDFLISVNVGEDIQSLGKVSSGGELSRITLAVKTAFAGKTGAGCLVFDEIDTGVSGGTSERIGKMLSDLANGVQVISVTHSPQIASIASTHILIEKNEIDGRTESNVRTIQGEDRISEIARIIGGVAVTEKQIAAAKEMLNNNNN